MDFTSAVASLTDFVQKIEGPYKWYVIGGVIIIMTAIISRLVFKTLKWLLLLGLLAVLIFAAVHYLGYI